MEVDHQNMSEVFPVPVQGVLSEVTAMYRPYIEKLFDSEQTKVLEGIKEIKNFVIGNNKQKTNFIVLGAVPRLVYLTQEENTQIDVKIQAVVVLGSLAKGIDTNVKYLLDQRVVENLCNLLGTTNLQLYEACIRCLRTIIMSPEASSKLLYFNPSVVIPQMLQNINKSTCTQECTCEVIGHCCATADHQTLLLNLDIINQIGNLLVSPVRRVKVKALDALSVICYKNYEACKQCAMSKIKDKPLVEILIRLLAQSQPNDVQLRAAKCLTYMFRAGVLTTESGECVIIRKVLPCAVRMCDIEFSSEERVSGAETIAYLTEVDPPLQRLAYICEQFPHKLENYFKHPTVGDTKNRTEMNRFKHALKYGHELRKAGFLAYASLLSNDEDIRKQVASENLVNHVAESITDSSSAVRANALKCLLSLSRSIHLLRTTFQDVGIWKALLKLMQESKQDLNEIKIISSILCNLLLDFCPSKVELKAAGLLQTLREWTIVEELKLNAVWALMNMSFHADTSLKLEILNTVGFEQILKLVSDNDRNVIIRTLGLLRNILSSDQDKIMMGHGPNIIQVCKHVLNTFSEAGAGNPELHAEYECIRAHTVCVLACIAGTDDSATIKNFLQNETEILQLIVSYLMHFHPNLQMAAISFIHNFVRDVAVMQPDCIDRQAIMTECGALASLQQLQTIDDSILVEKVEETIQQFQNTKM